MADLQPATPDPDPAARATPSQPGDGRLGLLVLRRVWAAIRVVVLTVLCGIGVAAVLALVIGLIALGLSSVTD